MRLTLHAWRFVNSCRRLSNSFARKPAKSQKSYAAADAKGCAAGSKRRPKSSSAVASLPSARLQGRHLAIVPHCPSPPISTSLSAVITFQPDSAPHTAVMPSDLWYVQSSHASSAKAVAPPDRPPLELRKGTSTALSHLQCIFRQCPLLTNSPT